MIRVEEGNRMTPSMRWVAWGILIAALLFILVSLALSVFNVNLTTSSTRGSGAFVAELR